MSTEFGIIMGVYQRMWNNKNGKHLGNIIAFNEEEIEDILRKTYPDIPLRNLYTKYLDTIFFNKCYKNDRILVSFELQEPEFEVDYLEEDPPIYVALFHSQYLLPNNTEINKSDFSRYSDMKRYILNQYDPIIVFPVYMDRYNDRIRITTEKRIRYAKQIGFVWMTEEQQQQQHLTNYECVQEIQSYIDYLNDSFYSNQMKIDIWDLQNEPGKKNFHLGSMEIDIQNKRNSYIEDIINILMNNIVFIKKYKIRF